MRGEIRGEARSFVAVVLRLGHLRDNIPYLVSAGGRRTLSVVLAV